MLRARSLIGIFLIVCAASCGWFILGATLFARSELTQDAERAALGNQWGTALQQTQPTFSVLGGDHNGAAVVAESTAVDADLVLDLRRKGLRWYPTYTVGFAAVYQLRNLKRGTRVEMCFRLPSDAITYDDVVVDVDGRTVPVRYGGGQMFADVPIPASRGANVGVKYRSRGLGTWTYRFGSDLATPHDIAVLMHTNFGAIDFPPGTLSPTAERRTPAGWDLTWSYHQLVTGAGVGMVFPTPMQPGPLAERITFWAPLSLLFYVFVMLVITTLRRIELHPVNYLFLAAAFFAFHLLFAYTVDRIRVEYAFAICSLVSMALTISYLRLVVGLRFAAVEAAGAQFFYLILFSYALFDEGYSGLAITIGAIVTLFVTMQLTGRIRWSERFARAPLAGTDV
jgi:Inner membrane protein CreD